VRPDCRSLTEVTDKLLDDGVKLFAEAFNKLLEAVSRTGQMTVAPRIDRQTWKLPADVAAAVRASLEEWRREDKVRRLWARDASLWTGTDEGSWLGWLGITDDQLAHLDHLTGLASDVRRAGFRHALLLGMGGSSLCPEVLRMTFGTVAGYPELHVLDSTDPAQVRAVEREVDFASTIFIVSSKSGGTLEPNIFKQYFFERARQAIGDKEAASRFIAITDPGSKMQKVAESDGFRHAFFGWPSIGGRYSALSDFGMAPAAIMGVDVSRFLDRAEEMVHACAASVPPEENPGVVLGAILGVGAARFGRDKGHAHHLAGHLGPGGVAGAAPGRVDREGRQGPDPGRRRDRRPSRRLRGRPRLRLSPTGVGAGRRAGRGGRGARGRRPSGRADLGRRHLRARPGILPLGVRHRGGGLDPRHQCVQPAGRRGEQGRDPRDHVGLRADGTLPPESPVLDEDGVKLFTDEKNAAALASAVGRDRSLTRYLRAHLDRLGSSDYFTVSGYIHMNAANGAALQAIRRAVRDRKRVATCLGFGPRFLHSTGQAYKGGPNAGVVLQVTCDDAADLPVPGQRYTFGVVKAAQARGDFQVLAERNRRALRVHLGPDVRAGLAKLQRAVNEALA